MLKPKLSGTVAVDNSIVPVELNTPLVDSADYIILTNVVGEELVNVSVSNKTTTSFNLNFSAINAQLNCDWILFQA